MCKHSELVKLSDLCLRWIFQCISERVDSDETIEDWFSTAVPAEQDDENNGANKLCWLKEFHALTLCNDSVEGESMALRPALALCNCDFEVPTVCPDSRAASPCL